MTRNVYALLVGINDYAPESGVGSLRGCVRDIQTVHEYLEDRIAPEQLNLVQLINEQATRQNVIDAFKNHLCQAGSDDTVLFYYAGHGSQEDAPEEFWNIEPDHLNETLVCYDSRCEGGLDLADKELAVLIGEVAQKNPHISIIFDSCHSGSGTRDLFQEMDERRLPKSNRKRPFSSYLGLNAGEIDSLKPDSRSPDKNPGGWSFPRGRHVLLAACRDHETAKESPSEDGQRRGVFSRFLMQALTQSNGNPSYRDLFQQVNALVRGNVAAQSPQLEAIDTGDLDLPFLGAGVIKPRKPYFTVSYLKEQGWVINGGAIHGIAPPTLGETTLLALFPFNPEVQGSEDTNLSPQPVGVAEVIAVQPQLSKISSAYLENLDSKTTLKAVVTSQPLPPVGIRLTAATSDDEAGIELVRSALKVAGDNLTPSLYVVEEPNPDKARFRLLAQSGEYLVTRPTDDRPLITQLRGYTPANASEAISNLEHIARWLKVLELNSPSSSRIPPEALKVEILEGKGAKEDAKAISDPQIRLEYKYNATTAKWEQPQFRIRLTNCGSDLLFCAFFDLTARFKIDASVLPGGTIRLNPGQTVWANEGKPIYGFVPEPLWKQGITETKDILKVIACTTDFDATMMAQGELGQPLPPPTRSATRGGGTLNRLMKRVITREFSSKPEGEENYDDWIATQVTFDIVRPQTAAIVSTETPVPLGMGVTLQPHPTFIANASLTTVNQSTRDSGNRMIPPILQVDAALVQPFQFTSSRGDDPGLSVLELTVTDGNEQTRESVTPDSPLTLTVAGETLEMGEQLLAFAYDGEFFLPVGAGKNKDRQLEISLERLPEPVVEGERSLQGSIRIFFQKILSKRLKFDFAYPLLSAVHVQSDGTVDPYDAVEVSVKEKVAQASRIVLFIHGIIGDTESMVPAVQNAKLEVNGDAVPLFHANVYDLVLAFDYENLNTSIADNARSLKQRLEAVGLGKGHGKTLHIVAHSMGGLVSRWFIEREGGKDIVNHLIMLGTPNNGSPWPNVVDFALPLLTVGLNGLAAVAWPVSAIGALMHLAGAATVGVERQMTIALKEMQPNSTLVESLFSSEPPGIPYTVIAGNTSLIQPRDPASQAKITALLQRVGRYVIEAPFMGIANDIAVTVNSITHLPERAPEAKIMPIACDHLTYFTNPIGLAALATAVSDALGLYR